MGSEVYRRRSRRETRVKGCQKDSMRAATGASIGTDACHVDLLSAVLYHPIKQDKTVHCLDYMGAVGLVSRIFCLGFTPRIQVEVHTNGTPYAPKNPSAAADPCGICRHRNDR